MPLSCKRSLSIMIGISLPIFFLNDIKPAYLLAYSAFNQPKSGPLKILGGTYQAHNISHPNTRSSSAAAIPIQKNVSTKYCKI